MLYGPNARALKLSFWEEQRSSRGGRGHWEGGLIPWIICGDFNATFSIEDKSSRALNLQEIHVADQFLLNLCLCEPLTMGRRFS